MEELNQTKIAEETNAIPQDASTVEIEATAAEEILTDSPETIEVNPEMVEITDVNVIDIAASKAEVIDADAVEILENATDESAIKKTTDKKSSKKKEVIEQEKLDIVLDEIDEIAKKVGVSEEENPFVESEDETDYESLSLEELVALMEELVKTEDINSVKNKFIKANIAYKEKYKVFKNNHKESYLAEGKTLEEYKFEDNGLQNNFNQSFKIYKQKRKEYNEAQEILKAENLKKKNIILEELRALIDSDEMLKKIYDEFKNLQDKWREIGMVPINDAKNLWMNYNFLVDKFFDKVQIDRELRDIGFKKNLEAKIEITEKTEELLLDKSIINSFGKLQEYHRLWREIGPVPHDKSDEIWERFKLATEKVNERRKEYYESIEGEQKNNLILKTDLCEKAESLAEIDYGSAKEWNEKSNEFDALFAEWRKIGPALKAQNDTIWTRFKTAMNIFYKNKKQYFNLLKDEHLDNLNLKIDLCKSAEAIQDSTDWKESTKELINLQNQWKKIGQVPKRNSEKIWKRFRTACDHYFNAKELYFKNIKNIEKENLDKKIALIEQIKTKVFSENKETALNEMKELQKQWIQIGQVPFTEKGNLYNDYRKAVEEKLSDIGLTAIDVEILKIKERIGDSTSNKEADYIIKKEINALSFKIDKIKSEITVYENNIGFFANSRNADTLKKEIQTKIDLAHENIKRMKSKMNQLDKTLRVMKEDEAKN